MFNVVLVAPEIPPNTGNVIRLCANSGARLHLVEPLGFSLDDKRLRRAGLDYHEYACVKVHASFDALLQNEGVQWQRCFAFTTRATRRYTEVTYAPEDWLVFGAETRGLDEAVRARFAATQLLRLPLRPGNRSLNLSNAVAIVVYEAWRQQGFAGGV
ncbi:MAG: tRNA (cytidine(34)-2'-O)-methyltransferase [Burkholderiaceae bacterium]|nr:tRNA (cytidine(34)-2'-O)-methyltransferase [Burkholderiaceae bacterium]